MLILGTDVSEVLDPSFGEITLETLKGAGFDLSRRTVKAHLAELATEEAVETLFMVDDRENETERSLRIHKLKKILLQHSSPSS
jgi:hypothetical protein